MMYSFWNGIGSVIIRVKIRDTTLTNNGGKTGLTNASAGLIISTIADNEATATTYTVAASHVQTITTLGTFAAPSASNCRFKEVDATNHPGLYEIQIANARWAVSGARFINVTVSGVTGATQEDGIIQLPSINAVDNTNSATPALPNAAAAAAGGLLTFGSGAGQINVDGAGNVKGDVQKWLAGTIPAVNVTGVPLVDLKYTLGTLSPAAAGSVSPDWGQVVNKTSAVALTSTTIATSQVVASVTGAVGSVTGAVGSVTAAVTLSAGDSPVMQSGTATAGAASTITIQTALGHDTLPLGCTIKITSGTGKNQARVITGYVDSTQVVTVDHAWTTNPDATSVYSILYTDLPALNSSLQVTPVGSTIPTTAQIATAVWQDATAGDFTVASSIGKSLYTGNNAPGAANGLFIAGSNTATTVNITGNITGNLSGSVGSVTGAVGSVTGNVGGNVVGTIGNLAAGAKTDVENAVWNATLTVSSHNTNNSAGRDLRLAARQNVIDIRDGTAQAGSTANTIKLDAGASATNNVYNGNLIVLTGGPGAGQTRTISSYNGATKVATVDQNWVTNPTNASTFSIYAAVNGQFSAEGSIVSSTNNTAVLDANASASDHVYEGSWLTIESGLGAGQTRNIITYVGATKTATVDSNWTTNPDTTSVYAVIPAGNLASDAVGAPTATQNAAAVWNSVAVSFNSAGSMGALLNAAGSVADPWSVALPGAYGVGTAGFIVGTNLNATVSSRLAAASYTTPPTTAQIATAIWEDLTAGGDFGTAGSIGLLLATDINATISSRLASVSYTTPPTVAQIATGIWQDLTASADFTTVGSVGALIVADLNATISSRASATVAPTWYTAPTVPPTTAQIATAIWQDLTASADFTTAGSIGLLLATDINATISSRSTYAGTDTPGTTTLLARIGGPITISGGMVAVDNNGIADVMLKRDWTLVSGEPASCLLNAERKLRNKWSLVVTPGFLTVYKEDGVTVAYTEPVVTTALAQPITAMG